MTTSTPSEHLPTADAAADQPGRVLMVVLPNHVVQRFLVGIVVVTFCGMFLALEAAFARWTPWVTTGGVGALVMMLCVHHMLAVLRRERPVRFGVARAFGFAALTAAVITGAFYLVRP